MAGDLAELVDSFIEGRPVERLVLSPQDYLEPQPTTTVTAGDALLDPAELRER